MFSKRPRRLSSLAQHSVQELKGVGAKRAEGLAALEIHSVLDLLTHYPRRYIDRTEQHSIADANEGDVVTVLAIIDAVENRRMRNGRTMVVAVASDELTSFSVSFFNQPWRSKQLKVGEQAVFSGKLGTYRKQLQMVNPLVDLVGDRTGRIVPVYPQSEKAAVNSWELAAWIEEALNRAGQLADPLDANTYRSLGFMSLTDAMRNVHMPSTMQAAFAAKKRLAFDELLRLQVILALRRKVLERTELGFAHTIDGDITRAFYASLPFSLTGAQARAIGEIAKDMESVRPMHRLLQGDVGSGKTLVAVAGFMIAAQGQHQSALMAPTEVLAEQHAHNVRVFLEDLHQVDEATLFGNRQLRVALLTNKTTAAKRKKLHEELRAGEIDVLIGTHALLTETVQFRSLGFVVIDEQHRFGVEQRSILRSKGADGHVPDVLVMTATPIPRTAAMTVYGDLQVSVLDELPPGRTPVVTKWAKNTRDQARVYQTVRNQIAAGRQAYVVCPLVEASERVQAKAATELKEELQATELAGLRVGLLHGQMVAVEKERVMSQFRAGELDVLVATTVIEVGIDVPNATVMVIQDAGRFGIAQLHQLRGRVGRGAKASYCYLVEFGESPEIVARLSALVESTDGFYLADVDLDLRGPGSVLGTRQKGISDLKLATLQRSQRGLIQQARDVAMAIVDQDPTLKSHEVLAGDIAELIDPEESEYLFKN